MFETKAKHDEVKNDKKAGEGYRVIGNLIIVIGVLGSLTLFMQSTKTDISIYLGIYVLVGCLFTSVFFFAIGKIIELLSEISNQLN